MYTCTDESKKSYLRKYGIPITESIRRFEAYAKQKAADNIFNKGDIVSLKSSYELGCGLILDKWTGHSAFYRGKDMYQIAFHYYGLSRFKNILVYVITGENDMLKHNNLRGSITSNHETYNLSREILTICPI